MAVIKYRKTKVVKGPWDGPKVVAEAANSVVVLESMHAWVADGASADKKTSYKFAHHTPGADAAANLSAVNNALARLVQEGIPEAEKLGVAAHLRAHRIDAGLPAAMSEAEIAEAVARIRDVDDLKVAEAAALGDAIRVQEGRNTAEWLESRLHLTLTTYADDLFGGGYVTRDERIALSHAIGVALDGYHQALLADAPQLFERSPWEDAPDPEDDVALSAAQTSTQDTDVVTLREEFVPLAEKALRNDGTVPIKIIQPGWGSSGFYDAKMLARDGARAFPAGTKMFWNHPSVSQESDRPERDLNDLAAELMSAARYNENGPKGPGLYADAKVFDGYRASVDSLGGSIGLSIRASGKAQDGEAEGRKGPIITALVPDGMNTVDFVTYPGAGGEVITMFEAARVVRTDKKTAGGVVPVVGATDRVAISESSTEVDMSAEEMKALQETVATLQAGNARALEALALRDAKDLVVEALNKLTQLPAATRARLLEALPRLATVKEGKLDTSVFNTAMTEAIKAEVKYLTEAAGLGSIKNLGESASIDDEAPEKVAESLEAAFSELGLKESTAKLAAKGRG